MNHTRMDAIERANRLSHLREATGNGEPMTPLEWADRLSATAVDQSIYRSELDAAIKVASAHDALFRGGFAAGIKFERDRMAWPHIGMALATIASVIFGFVMAVTR